MALNKVLKKHKEDWLKEELDSEHEELTNLKLNKDQIRSLWEISKTKLEENKAEQRDRQGEKVEAEGHHRELISVYDLRLKHALSEKRDAISELKIDNAVSSVLVEQECAQSENQLRTELHTSTLDFRHNKLSNENTKKGLKLIHEEELSEIRKDFTRRRIEIDAKNHHKKQWLIKKQEQRWRRETRYTEERQSRFTTTLMGNLNKTLQNCHKQNKNTQKQYIKDLIPVLRSLADTDKEQELVTWKLEVFVPEERHLSERIQKGQEELNRQCFKNYDKNEKLLATGKARLKVVTEEDRELQIENELLQQASEKVEQDRDKLLRKQGEALLCLQQKSCLRRLLAGSNIPLQPIE